jgi:hypothetical protein
MRNFNDYLEIVMEAKTGAAKTGTTKTKKMTVPEDIKSAAKALVSKDTITAEQVQKILTFVGIQDQKHIGNLILYKMDDNISNILNQILEQSEITDNELALHPNDSGKLLAPERMFLHKLVSKMKKYKIK